MILRNGGLLIAACLASASYAAADDVGHYPINRTIDNVVVSDVTVETTADGIRVDTAVTLPACPGLSRLSGHLTITWTSATGETLSHDLYFSNSIEPTSTHLRFQEPGFFGSAVGGNVDVEGQSGCTGD